MSEKRWLIRTRSKQILGPASKEKIISLLENNSLSDDDELTSGNGYWFWVREKQFVEKYLYSDSLQGFNPISEAETKLGPFLTPKSTGGSPKPVESSVLEAASEEPIFPSDDDLAFPESIAIQAEDLSARVDHGEDSETIEDDDKGPMVDMADMVRPLKKELLESKEDEEVLELEKPRKVKGSRSNDRYLFVLLIILMAALAGVFYYYRTVLGRPIPIIGMADAHAQGFNSLVKKKTVVKLNPLTSKQMTFIPELSLNGLGFSLTDISGNSPCHYVNDYLFKAGLILHLKNGNKAALDYVSRCRSSFSEELNAILEIPRRGRDIAVFNYLKKRVSNKALRFKLASHYRQYLKVKSDQESFMLISEKLLKDSKIIGIKETERNQLLKEIKNLSESPWKDILLMNLSTYSDNISWTEKLLQNLNTFGPYLPLFYGLDKVEVNDQKLSSFLTVTIDRTQKKLKNNDHKFFVSRLVDYSGRKVIYKELENRFSALWSLNELRELYLDPFVKFNYFDFILEKMLQRASESEIKTHLRQTIKKEIIRDMRTRQMWTLQLFYPKDEKLRKSILSKMGEIWIEGTFLEKYQVLVNLENAIIKKGLSRRYPGLERARYKIEKDFYTELIFSGKGTQFAFSELYRLGDHRSEYLWLLAFL